MVLHLRDVDGLVLLKVDIDKTSAAGSTLRSHSDVLHIFRRM
jgi:hypothetical protein